MRPEIDGYGPAPASDARPRRLIGIHLLPSAATLGNLLCGFFGIYCCLLSIRAAYFPISSRFEHTHLAHFFPSYIAVGAYLVVLAMIFDALDGRLARMARRTSEFGAQLDSIADIVSFGAAPAMLFITLLLRLAVPVAGDQAEVTSLEWRIGVLSAIVYVSCAAIRLARYNAENTQDEAGQQRFSGLPSPAAAAAVIAMLILHEDLVRAADVGGADFSAPVRWLTSGLVLIVGLLMVSRLDYVHVFNVYVRRKHPPIHLVWLIVAAAIAWFSPQILLVVLAYAYIISGVSLNLLRSRRRKLTPPGLDSARVNPGTGNRTP